MDTVIEVCAGLDVHKESVTANFDTGTNVVGGGRQPGSSAR